MHRIDKKNDYEVIVMSNLQAKFEAIIEDVNQEDGLIITAFEKILDGLFFLIKWGGIPLVIYLFVSISSW